MYMQNSTIGVFIEVLFPDRAYNPSARVGL